MNIEVRNAYDRRMTVWKTLLLVALVALFADKVSAQAPPYIVQHNGQQAFSANALQHADQSPVYNFCDTPAQCGSTPPPIPPNDPLAMNTIILRQLARGCAQSTTTTGQDFWQVFGRPVNYPVSPIITTWPGYVPVNVGFTIPPGKRYDGVFSLPANPGTRLLTIKFSGYANCMTATYDYVDVRVEAIAPTLAPVGTCSKHAFPDNAPLFPLDPVGGLNAHPNMIRCNLRPLGQYRWIAQPSSGGALTVLITSSAT